MLFSIIMFGCAKVIPQVYITHTHPMTTQGLAVTTYYPDESIEDLRGTGTLQGRITSTDIYQSPPMLKLTMMDDKARNYTIKIPGWSQKTVPVKAGWWVVVEYAFGDQGEWLRLLAQGHGQVLMFYQGVPGAAITADPVVRCKPHKRVFLTSSFVSMVCQRTLEHFSTACRIRNVEWNLDPGDTRIFANNQHKSRDDTGQLILHVVDATRVIKSCNDTMRNQLTYYWFRPTHTSALKKHYKSGK